MRGMDQSLSWIISTLLALTLFGSLYGISYWQTQKQAKTDQAKEDSEHKERVSVFAQLEQRDQQMLSTAATGEQSKDLRQPLPHGVADWEYSGPKGPQRWSHLHSQNRRCRDGLKQSPIDILTRTTRKAQPQQGTLSFHYKMGRIRIWHDGQSIAGQFSSGGSVDYREVNYQLQRFHLRVPSEHRIDQRVFEAELQLYHQSRSGSELAIGVLIEPGKAKSDLIALLENPPQQAGQQKDWVRFDSRWLLPENTKGVYHYEGSLTYPPCRQPVGWFILASRLRIPTRLLDQWVKTLRFNARAPQPMHARDVVRSF